MWFKVLAQPVDPGTLEPYALFVKAEVPEEAILCAAVKLLYKDDPEEPEK
jgi:hypothetical protein